AQALDHGIRPDTTPRDAEWGERYFHVTDPDGHELSFARPLSAKTQTQEAREASG
ncbi:MAG: VOC family protein, partial [Gammaproteobacteria bacterium]